MKLAVALVIICLANIYVEAGLKPPSRECTQDSNCSHVCYESCFNPARPVCENGKCYCVPYKLGEQVEE